MLQIITCSYSFISDQANVPENLRGFAKCKGLGTGEACCQTLFFSPKFEAIQDKKHATFVAGVFLHGRANQSLTPPHLISRATTARCHLCRKSCGALKECVYPPKCFC